MYKTLFSFILIFIVGCSESEKQTHPDLTLKQIAQAQEDVKFVLLNNENINYVSWVYEDIYVGVKDKGILNKTFMSLVCNTLKQQKLGSKVIFVDGNKAALIDGFMIDKYQEHNC